MAITYKQQTLQLSYLKGEVTHCELSCHFGKLLILQEKVKQHVSKVRMPTRPNLVFSNLQLYLTGVIIAACHLVQPDNLKSCPDSVMLTVNSDH